MKSITCMLALFLAPIPVDARLALLRVGSLHADDARSKTLPISTNHEFGRDSTMEDVRFSFRGLFETHCMSLSMSMSMPMPYYTAPNPAGSDPAPSLFLAPVFSGTPSGTGASSPVVSPVATIVPGSSPSPLISPSLTLPSQTPPPLPALSTVLPTESNSSASTISILDVSTPAPANSDENQASGKNNGNGENDNGVGENDNGAGLNAGDATRGIIAGADDSLDGLEKTMIVVLSMTGVAVFAALVAKKVHSRGQAGGSSQASVPSDGMQDIIL